MTARPVPGGYRWNAALHRYIDARGRIVSGATVRRGLDLSIDAYKGVARSLAEQLRAGTITLNTWDLEMRTLIKDTHLLSIAGAVGGWAQLDQSSLGRAGRAIRDQYDFLTKFTHDIASGKQKLDGTLATRAVMYVEAGRGTYEQQREVEDREAGLDEERNIRHASDSCVGCLRETARSWVTLGALVPIGSRNCLTRCKCQIERRRSTAPRRPTPRPPRAGTRRTARRQRAGSGR